MSDPCAYWIDLLNEERDLVNVLQFQIEMLKRVKEAAENLRDAPPIGTEGWLLACESLTEALAALEDKEAHDA